MDFTAVEESANRLRNAGFQELKESEHWTIEPLKKYFVTKYVLLVIYSYNETKNKFTLNVKSLWE